MRLETQYEWELEGDLAASVFLELAFEARVVGISLMSLQLIQLDVDGVTFATSNSDIVCDGRGKNASLPPALRRWFAGEFLNEYETNENLRNEFHKQLEQRAIGEHYERLANVGAA